jgi:hypothetical protein
MPSTELNKLFDTLSIQSFDTKNGEVLLKELGAGGGTKLNDFYLGGLTNKSFICKLDCKNKISEYFNKSYPGVHKGCDYIIYSEQENEKYILFCELKSDNPRGFDKQIRNSMIFWDYVSSILLHYGNIDISSSKRIPVLFSTSKLRKSRTSKLLRKEERNELLYIDAGNPSRINIDRIIKSFNSE